MTGGFDPATYWWLENTGQGRRTQRRMLPESALGPRARAEAREEREERERERRDDERRCLLQAGHDGDHVYRTRKPIGDRYRDGEFGDRVLSVPGVSVPANRPRCRATRRYA